jgi:integrase
VVERAFAERRLDCLYLFHNDGNPIVDCRRAWKTACAKAGLSGLLVHDLRRSGIRNMVRSGISEAVAMKISGHKTRTVFDRYDITSESDLAAAAVKLDAYLDQRAQEPAKVTPIRRAV